MVLRLLRATALGLGVSLGLLGFATDATAQPTATCQLNPDDNRTYGEVPLEGALKSTEEQLDAELPFLQYLPNGHNPAQQWPVILFMHGIGEVGGTLRGNTAHSLPRVVESPNWDWPFIVLSPVLPSNGWLSRSQLVSDILDHAVANLGGDPNRLYLTGLSHGGEGTVAIGIELSTRVAALMPVTQGGGVDNWDQRTNIVDIPFMAIIGTLDGEYDNALGWAMDLEASGAPAFSHYLIPTVEEHDDSIPMTALGESHVFVSYDGIPHDVWHAAYGTFCEVLTTYKTVQYNWLLNQSLDGSMFVDPRSPGGMAGAGGTAGVGGMMAAGGGGASAGGAGGMVAMGGANMAAGGSAGSGGSSPAPVMPSGGTTAAAGTGGGAPTGAPPPLGNTSTEAGSEGGGCAMTSNGERSGAVWMLALAAGLMARMRRRAA